MPAYAANAFPENHDSCAFLAFSENGNVRRASLQGQSILLSAADLSGLALLGQALDAIASQNIPVFASGLHSASCAEVRLLFRRAAGSEPHPLHSLTLLAGELKFIPPELAALCRPAPEAR